MVRYFATFGLPYIFGAALLAVSVWPSSSRAELWRCEGNVFSNRAAIGEHCEPFSGSRVCGNGLNRFFTPERAGLSSVPEVCEPKAPAASPFVNAADVKRETNSPRNWERKLTSRLARETSREGLRQDLGGEIEQLKRHLPMISGGTSALKPLGNSN